MVLVSFPPRVRSLIFCALLLGLVIGFCTHKVSAQQRVPSDFNADGMSELVLISLGKTLSWSPFDTTTGAISDAGIVGVPGDHAILADWLGLGRPQIGVVKVERGTQNIIWRIRDAQGQAIERRFGKVGDTVFAAADFDNSGAADAVVFRREGRKIKWLVAYDLMKGGTATAEYYFGRPSDKMLYADLDGNGLQFAAVSLKATTTQIRLLDPRAGTRKTIKNLPVVKKQKGTVTSLAVKSPTGQEVVAIVKSYRKKTTFTILNPKKKNQNLRVYTIAANGDSVVGNFMTDAGYEVGVKTKSGVTMLNPFTKVRKSLVTPDGVIVDEININKLVSQSSGGEEPTPVPTTTPGSPVTPGDPIDPSQPASLRRVCASTSSISIGEMLIKSEISNHIHNGDPRATGYTVVCARLCPRNLSYTSFFYANGEFAGAVGMYGRFAGNGQPRLYGAAGSAPQHSAAEISAKAVRIGNGKLYMQISADTEGAGTVCKEFSPIGRNGGL